MHSTPESKWSRGLVKGQHNIILLVKSQSKYLAGQHSDRERRSECRIYECHLLVLVGVLKDNLVVKGFHYKLVEVNTYNPYHFIIRKLRWLICCNYYHTLVTITVFRSLWITRWPSASFSCNSSWIYWRIISLILSSRSVIPTNSTSAQQFSRTFEALLCYVTELTKPVIQIIYLLRSNLHI